MSVFVGVDGGGTHARAVVIDETGKELARYTGGAGIVDPRNPETAAHVIVAVVEQVLSTAGLSIPVDALCCGLAGAGRPEQSEAVTRSLLTAAVAQRVLVVGDAETAMYDAFGNDPGVLLIAGTGSIAWARNAAGEVFRVGGWGQLLGDEGSAYDIGLQALRAVARAADGRAAPTVLTELIVSDCGVSDVADLIAWGAVASKAQIGALAPTILACAETRDAAAVQIRANALEQLLVLLGTALKHAGTRRISLALAGGLIEPGRPLFSHLTEAAARFFPDVTVRDIPIDAARGAAAMALESVTKSRG
jgi:N-acetylglucosamine kinase-like BadF-type ATPase